MQQLSNAHIKVIVNGNRMTGLAAEDRPYEFPSPEDMMDVSVRCRRRRLRVVGPDVRWAFRHALRAVQPLGAVLDQPRKKPTSRRRSTARKYLATRVPYSDPEQGRAATMEGGFLMSCPDMSEPGQTFEVVVYYARITPDVDGAVFEPPTS